MELIRNGMQINSHRIWALASTRWCSRPIALASATDWCANAKDRWVDCAIYRRKFNMQIQKIHINFWKMKNGKNASTNINRERQFTGLKLIKILILQHFQRCIEINGKMRNFFCRFGHDDNLVLCVFFNNSLQVGCHSKWIPFTFHSIDSGFFLIFLRQNSHLHIFFGILHIALSFIPRYFCLLIHAEKVHFQ